jgi:hypothetical protein
MQKRHTTSARDPRQFNMGNGMSFINKETLDQDKRALTVFLIRLNVALAGAFLLICVCSG